MSGGMRDEFLSEEDLELRFPIQALGGQELRVEPIGKASDYPRCVVLECPEDPGQTVRTAPGVG